MNTTTQIDSIDTQDQATPVLEGEVITGNEWAMRKRMEHVALIAALLLSLTGCAFTGNPTHDCPNLIPQRDYDALRAKLTIEEQPFRQIVRTCAGFASGCIRGYTVYIAKEEKDPNAVIGHEVCHLYRQQVLRVPEAQDSRHEGWLARP